MGNKNSASSSPPPSNVSVTQLTSAAKTRNKRNNGMQHIIKNNPNIAPTMFLDTYQEGGSVIFMVSWSPTLFYDGLNPGIGVTRVMNEKGEVEEEITKTKSSETLNDVQRRALKLIVKGHSIFKVLCGRLHTHLLTTQGKILSFGSNSSGQLACGVTGTVSSKHGVVKAVGEITQHFVMDGAGGGYHSIFLTSDHRVFVCGSNSSKQLGTTKFESTATPYELPASSFDNRKVVACAASNSHSVFLTECGKIYFAGDNPNGSCGGLKTMDRPLLYTNSLLSDENILKISCGYDNTVLVCESGKAFGLRCNSCGQLALPGKAHENFSDLKQVFENRKDIADANAGYFCSSVKSVNGEYFYCPGSITDFTPIEQIFNKPSSIIASGAGDSILWVTEEPGDNDRRGRMYLKETQTALDVTGEFCLPNTFSAIEITAQRDLFVIYFSGSPAHLIITHHFMFLECMLNHLTAKKSSFDEHVNTFTDCKIIV